MLGVHPAWQTREATRRTYCIIRQPGPEKSSHIHRQNSAVKACNGKQAGPNGTSADPKNASGKPEIRLDHGGWNARSPATPAGSMEIDRMTPNETKGGRSSNGNKLQLFKVGLPKYR